MWNQNVSRAGVIKYVTTMSTNFVYWVTTSSNRFDSINTFYIEKN